MAKVAVIVPNYNHAQFLSQRIESVLGQTYTDFKLLILDDMSSDDSREVIERYRSDDRVRVLYNAENSGGTYFQWNKGIAETSSDYIWIAESDDYADSALLGRLVQQLDAQPTVGMAVCESVVVDEHNNRLGIYRDIFRTNPAFSSFGYPVITSDIIQSGRDYCRSYMLPQNTIPNASAVLFRRAAFHEIGGAVTEMRICGDWMTYCKMLMRFDICRVPEPLNFFRAHKNNVRSSTKVHTYLLEHRLVREYIRAELGARESFRRHAASLMIESLMLIGEERRPPYDKVPIDRLFALLGCARKLGPELLISTLCILAKEQGATLLQRLGLRRRPTTK